jgi:hypothetical protein
VLLGAERVPPADQARLVRVDDPALARPDLHAHDAVAQHALLHEPVETLPLGAVAGEDAVGEGRLHDSLRREDRQLARVVHGLPPPELAQDEHRRDPEHEHRREPGEHELTDRSGDGRSGRRVRRATSWNRSSCSGGRRQHAPRPPAVGAARGG